MVELHRGVGIGIGDANYLGGAQKFTGFTNRAEEQRGGRNTCGDGNGDVEPEEGKRT